MMNFTQVEGRTIRSRVSRPLLRATAMPIPRVEIYVARKKGEPGAVECDQRLIMGLRDGDGRREQLVGGQLVDVPWMSLHMGFCIREVSEQIELAKDSGDGTGWIYCDDALMARAVWDGEELGLPVFVVAEDRCQRVDSGSAEDPSDEAVYGLISETEAGTSCSLHASRALAETELRSSLGEYTTLAASGAQGELRQDLIDDLIRASRVSEIHPKGLDWYCIERMRIRGFRQKQQGQVRAPMVIAFQLHGLTPQNDRCATQEATALVELTVDAQDERWISAWSMLLNLEGERAEMRQPGTVRIQVDSVMNCYDLGIGLCEAVSKAREAGFEELLISLRAIPDPAMAQCERVRAVLVNSNVEPEQQTNLQDLWKWVEANASFISLRSSGSQSNQMILCMDRDLDDVPSNLETTILKAKADRIRWLMFGYGT